MMRRLIAFFQHGGIGATIALLVAGSILYHQHSVGRAAWEKTNEATQDDCQPGCHAVTNPGVLSPDGSVANNIIYPGDANTSLPFWTPSATTSWLTTNAGTWTVQGEYTRPNPRVTPGAVRTMSKAEICSTSWGTDRRHVTLSMKREVARLYQIGWSNRAAYEFDHLIPRSLGGADAIENLWPEPLGEAKHIKDPLEVRLWKGVCLDDVPLKVAQDVFRDDWRQGINTAYGAVKQAPDGHTVCVDAKGHDRPCKRGSR